MKNFNKLAIFTFAMFGFAVTANAQSTADATATTSATVVAPIAITNNGSMNFGQVLSKTGGGVVILNTDGTIAQTSTAATSNNTVTTTAATFNVTGQSGYTYSVSVPASATIKTAGDINADGTVVAGSVKSMTINDFKTSFGTTNTGTINANAISFGVGATLLVGDGQAAGEYTGTFNVTVAYN